MGHRSSALVRTAAVMGTVASIHVHDDADDASIEAAIDAVLVELERLEAMFSTFRPTSEISRINDGALHLLDASPEVIEVLDACTALEHLSGGAFTTRPPDRPGVIDPAGFVKGWATERASTLLTGAGLMHWYVGVGGDVQTHGSPRPVAPWNVAIADPNLRGNIAVVLDIYDDNAVATSGVSERGRHIWAHSGRTNSLASITVAGPHLTWADAYATAAFAMGEAGLDWIAQRDGYEAFAIRFDGTELTTL